MVVLLLRDSGGPATRPMSSQNHAPRTDPMHSEAVPPESKASDVFRSLEFAAAVLLGLAGVAAAWCTYQAAEWDGNQSFEYTTASGLNVRSARASAEANALRAVDLAVFTSWVDAYAQGDSLREAFYRERFRPEFRPAFDVWVESRPLLNPDAAPSPFALSEYRLAAEDEAQELQSSAEAALERGELANFYSDRFVLNAALMAVVLFLTGIAQHFKVPGIQRGLLVVAGGVFLLAVVNILSLPRP